MRKTTKRSTLLVTTGLLLALGAPGLRGDDFIRGDTNGDGILTLADSGMLNGRMFWGTELPCLAAGDFDADGSHSVSDALAMELFLLGPGDPPAAPYPAPGPATTTDGGSDCETYAPIPTADDPEALIRVHDAVAPGGDDVHAIIPVSIAHSLPLWSFFGSVEIGDGNGADLVEDSQNLGKDFSLEVLFDESIVPSPPFERARVKDGRLQFGTMIPFQVLPPQDETQILAIKICLRGGVPAGEYPLTLDYGDFSRGLIGSDPHADPEAGRTILPRLYSGTLTVLENVHEFATCRVRPLDGVNVRFTLGDATGAIGRNVAVPMFVNGDREGHGFGFEVNFDNAVLEATRIEQVFTRPDDLPFVDEFSEIDNEAGAVRAFFKSSSHSERHFLPPYQDNPVVVLHFRVKSFAESTALSFNEEYRLTTYKAFDDNYSPETAESFVFVDATVQVVPDISLFIRGDSNGDSLVNISDAQTTLSFLFVDGEPPHCFDAADANDDGLVDISDAIRTLVSLFTDSSVTLPEPTGAPGLDPTPDGIGCLE